jgi:hypothetical protein
MQVEMELLYLEDHAVCPPIRIATPLWRRITYIQYKLISHGLTNAVMQKGREE